MTKYDVVRYTDSQVVGSIELTAEQFAEYEQIAQQPEGLIRLGDKAAFTFYELDAEYRDLSENTAVYLEAV